MLGGWEFAGIGLFQTGIPLTPTLRYDNLGIGGGTARPNVNGTSQLPGQRLQWFDHERVHRPRQRFHLATRPWALRGPGRANFNLSLFKSFRIPFGSAYPEGAQLQFRAEAFNAFNHTQFHDVGTSFSSQNFGQVTTPTTRVYFSLE